jgi:hypothetical protein
MLQLATIIVVKKVEVQIFSLITRTLTRVQHIRTYYPYYRLLRT